MNFENLPETWKVVRLVTLVAEKKSGDWGIEFENEGYIGCHVIRGTDFPACEQKDFSTIPFRYVKRTKYESNLPRVGDILIELSGGSKDQPVGRTLLLDEVILSRLSPLFFTNFVKLLRFKKIVFPQYIYHILKWLYINGKLSLYQKQGGGQIRNFELNQFLEGELIPLPPLPEQKHIAEILSLAEELIRKQKEAIALIDKILMAKFLEMFGDPATNPKGWEVERLGKVAKLRYGKTLTQKDFTESGYPVFGANRIIGFYKEYLYEEPQVLISCRGAYSGVINLSPPKAFVTNNSIVVDISKNLHIINKLYLFYYLRYLGRDKLISGTAQPQVTIENIFNLTILLPPIGLQQQFAQIVEEFEKKREEMQKTLETLESLFRLLQKKAFTGELTAEWREKYNIQWELPKITERQAILLASIYYHQNLIQKPAMVTVVMKSAFLLQQEAGLNLNYDFIPYKYGSFSKEIYEDIEELEKNLLVERVKPKKDIEMTEIKLIDEFKDWVESIIETLPQEIKDTIKSYVEKYGKMELNELLDYVYNKYPQYSERSKRNIGRR